MRHVLIGLGRITGAGTYCSHQGSFTKIVQLNSPGGATVPYAD